LFLRSAEAKPFVL